MSLMFADVSRELLRSGQSIRFRALGVSMQPTIASGEMLTVEPVNPADIRCSEIILFRSRRRGLTAHRVLRIERSHGVTRFVLKGDSCATPDEPIESEQILGRVVYVERGAHHIKLKGARARIAYKLRLRLNNWSKIAWLMLSVIFSERTHD